MGDQVPLLILCPGTLWIINLVFKTFRPFYNCLGSGWDKGRGLQLNSCQDLNICWFLSMFSGSRRAGCTFKLFKSFWKCDTLSAVCRFFLSFFLSFFLITHGIVFMPLLCDFSVSSVAFRGSRVDLFMVWSIPGESTTWDKQTEDGEKGTDEFGNVDLLKLRRIKI